MAVAFVQVLKPLLMFISVSSLLVLANAVLLVSAVKGIAVLQVNGIALQYLETPLQKAQYKQYLNQCGHSGGVGTGTSAAATQSN